MHSIEEVKEVSRSAALLELGAHAWSLGSEEEAREVIESTIKILEKEEVL